MDNSKITEAQYDSIIKKMDIMQETMDRRFNEWSEDRKTIADLDIRLKILEAKVDGARDDIADQTKKVLNKVEEHLEPISDMTADAVHDAVENIKKKSWFNALKK